MLVEDGKVRLTDPVAKFIPELQTLTVVVPNAGGRSAPAPSGAMSAPLPTRTVSRGSADHRPRSPHPHRRADERRRQQRLRARGRHQAG